jgi:apolipoprotein D and lipocalin family protein
MGNTASNLPPLKHVANCETAKFMGTWFVIGVKPTPFEKTNSNAVETYTLMEDKNYDIKIDFYYNKMEPIASKLLSANQKGWIIGDKSNSGEWKVSPFPFIKFPYLILEVGESYEYCVIGFPNRNYAWIMGRRPVMPDETYNMLVNRLRDTHGYDLTGLRKVPQHWTREERSKRGLTANEIPDDMLAE